MKNILEIINLSADFLEKKGIERAKREAEWLIAAALSMSRMDLYLHFDRPLDEIELAACREMVRRRANSEPYEYIVGKRTFRSCQIDVTPAVLIPRNETECLVEKISKVLREEGVEGKRLLDLCTGSGAIAIALKKEFPSLEVVGSDISASAIAVAKKNGTINEVAVTFHEGDLFSHFEGQVFDYFVSNPPYVSEGEWESLPRSVKEFEPKIALLGGREGLNFYERIATDLPRFLKKGGKGWLEIGEKLGGRVNSLFQKAGFLTTLERDYSEKDRFLSIHA